MNKKVAIKCPICKRIGLPEWQHRTTIPIVKKSGKIGKVKSVLAECCATIYLIKEEI